MANTVEVISLIYRSTKYLDFIIDQMKRYCEAPGWEVSCRIVSNNPTVKVAEHLKKTGFPQSECQAPTSKKNDYYLNNVYRAWNFAVQTSEADHVCLVNSDMAFSPGWLSALLKHHDGKTIPTSWLIESGRLVSDLPPTINKNFGFHPSDFNEKAWLEYAASVKKEGTFDGGTFMPVIFEKKRFLECGMYPEGNLYNHPWKGRVVGEWGFGLPPEAAITGDKYLFYEVLEQKFGMKHKTIFESVVYHTQSGEMLGPEE